MNQVTDRLELFRQIRVSVRGSKTILLVGVDIAKNTHHAFFGTPNGRTHMTVTTVEPIYDMLEHHGFMPESQRLEF